MKTGLRVRGYLGVSAFLALWVASSGAQPLAARRVKAFVSILPQAYFVERVGGSQVSVEVLVTPGQSHETYEPTPKQMAALSEANVYFRIGLPFETQLIEKITAANLRLRVIDMREGIRLRPMDEGDAHERGGAPDPHIWLAPQLVKTQAEHIARTLGEFDPAHAPIFQQNLFAFQCDLNRVDSTIADVLAPLRGRKFYVFHPAYGYFADAYGLKQVAVETGGKEPSARQIAELIDQARQDSVRVVFVQPQFATNSAQKIAEAIGGAVVPLDPLARDYLDNLEQMAHEIKRALSRNAAGTRP